MRLEVRNRLWLAASLLVILALLVGGCAGQPKSIKPLTDNEKNRLIEIALNTPEASAWLEKESTYKADVRWIAIRWENSKAVGWAVLDYEDIADGTPPQFVWESATIYPRVLIRFGEPERTHVMVAIDRDTEQVVLVERLPVKGGPSLKPPPTPTKTPPSEPPEDAN